MNSDPIFVRAVTFGQPTKQVDLETVRPKIDKHLRYRRDVRRRGAATTANHRAPCSVISRAALLTVAAATSQQVRITPNNFGHAGEDRGCVQLLTVLSTHCSAAASRRSAEVVRAEKEKK
jgi:hypothetical protein